MAAYTHADRLYLELQLQIEISSSLRAATQASLRASEALREDTRVVTFRSSEARKVRRGG